MKLALTLSRSFPAVSKLQRATSHVGKFAPTGNRFLKQAEGQGGQGAQPLGRRSRHAAPFKGAGYPLGSAGGKASRIAASLFAIALLLPAQAMALPTIVEMFTSRFCPSCPAAEKSVDEYASKDPTLLVILENVDYWDRPGQTDPHGKPEFTQRQYDYSNTLADRPGKVFTPQPILNGSHVVEPPLWMRWDGTLKANRMSPQPAELTLERTETGGLAVTVPEGLKTTHAELWVLAYEPIEGKSIHRGTGVATIPLGGKRTIIPAPSLPKGKKHLVMLQEPGLGKIIAAGIK